jgi:hypothetical protein
MKCNEQAKKTAALFREWQSGRIGSGAAFCFAAGTALFLAMLYSLGYFLLCDFVNVDQFPPYVVRQSPGVAPVLFLRYGKVRKVRLYIVGKERRITDRRNPVSRENMTENLLSNCSWYHSAIIWVQQMIPDHTCNLQIIVKKYPLSIPLSIPVGPPP